MMIDISELSCKAISTHIKDESIWLCPCEGSQAGYKHLSVHQWRKRESRAHSCAQTLFSAFCPISRALVPVSADWKNWDIPQLEHA